MEVFILKHGPVSRILLQNRHINGLEIELLHKAWVVKRE